MTSEITSKNKALAWELQLKLSAVSANPTSVHDMLKGYLHDDVVLHAMHPVNEQRGEAAVFNNFWKPFVESFPDFERHTGIFLGGNFKGAEWVSSSGSLLATFHRDWNGIPATGQLVSLRFGECLRIESGKIREIYLLIDVLDLMRQANVWPLASSLGKEDWWPAPSNHKGIVLHADNPAETHKTLKLHSHWIDELRNFPEDQDDLDVLPIDDYLHARYMQYASSGFGATRGTYGLKEHFLKPLFSGFSERKMGHYQVRFAESNILTALGWESMVARHTGAFLEREQTGQKINLRSLQWWRRVGERFKENWMMIDAPDLLAQLGVDVFAEMRDLQSKDAWL